MPHQDVRSERGISLVEMMVTMTITMVIMAGALRAYQDGRRAVVSGTTYADTNQDLRAAINLMARDLIQTGREMPNGGIPMPSGVGAVAVKRPGPPGAALTFAASFDNTLPAICPGQALGPTINNVTTDIVTNLFADATLDLNQYPLASIQADGSKMTVDARTNINDATTGLRPGDLIWFTNGLGDAIQTVTRVLGQDVFFDAGDAFQFNQRGAAAGTIIQIRGGATFTTTSATRVIMVTYFIDTITVPGQFRLMREIGFGPARLIAQGIDNLQATYDIVDGTVNPTNQVDALDPYNPVQIRKVNLFMAGRSDLRWMPLQQPLRLSIATQVSLRAMSFVNRYE